MSSTIKDVAKEAGVSTASVSRVVNSFPSVSPEVREKVERAMKKLRFVPDRKAKSLATGKTGSVVFLTSYETLFEDPHKFAILSGIEHSLARYKYRVYFLQVERGDLAPLRKMASQKEMDGLVVHGIEITPSLLDIVHEFAIPTLLIGEPKEKCSLSWIDNNNEVCGEVAANCLLSHGRTHFLFVGGEERRLGKRRKFPRRVAQNAARFFQIYLHRLLARGVARVGDGHADGVYVRFRVIRERRRRVSERGI